APFARRHEDLDRGDRRMAIAARYLSRGGGEESDGVDETGAVGDGTEHRAAVAKLAARVAGRGVELGREARRDERRVEAPQVCGERYTPPARLGVADPAADAIEDVRLA